MSFHGQTVVVLGASGVVGSGVVCKFLGQGATVVGVSRSQQNLERLIAQMGLFKAVEDARFVPVVGDFQDEDGALATRRSVLAALTQGVPIDHVVSVLGFVSPAKPPTDSPLSALTEALADGLYNNFLAAKAFIPALKSRKGASFTLVSGGLAHNPPPSPGLWLGTVKNAALNALTMALATETAKDEVRVNSLCIHFGVAPVGGNKNQFGMPSEGDTLRLAPAFLGLARGGGGYKGQVVCLRSWDDAERLGQATTQAV